MMKFIQIYGFTLLFVFNISVFSGCSGCSHSGRKSLHQQAQNPSNDSPKPSNTRNRPAAPRIGNIVDLTAFAEPCVFLVGNFDENGNQTGLGTGFFIENTGIAVSNAHVFAGGSSWSVKMIDGTIHRVINILKQSTEEDYVVFRVEGDNFQCLPIAHNRPQKGEEIVVLGNPTGLQSTVSKGIVSALRPNDVIQIDAAISPGSSGSPVMNMSGEVIGIATKKKLECENCNFAIDIHKIK